MHLKLCFTNITVDMDICTVCVFIAVSVLSSVYNQNISLNYFTLTLAGG